MPANDILESLGPSFGDSYCIKSTTDEVFLVALHDRKPKLLVSNCGTTARSNEIIRRYVDNTMKEMLRPRIMDEYEKNKGAVDTSNNRRDNLISFHDIMNTYKWEVRWLSFFLAVAEANAFSAYKVFASDGADNLDLPLETGTKSPNSCEKYETGARGNSLRSLFEIFFGWCRPQESIYGHTWRWKPPETHLSD